MRRDKGKTVMGILAAVLILLLLMQWMKEPERAGNEFMETMMNQKSYAEIAETLRELGIDGVSDELVKELDKSYDSIPQEVLMDLMEMEQPNKTAMLLTAVGSGTYDYENWTWTPGSSSVYAFDVEVMDISHMYTNFLKGVSAIGCGELEFTNVAEDMSQVDEETGTGKRIVTFDWKGESYTLEAEENQDWFDVQVAESLNEIIVAKGGTKKLYFASDGYQECIIFYCDRGWAERFQKKTGLNLEN